MISLEHVNKYFWGASRFKRYYFECRARRKIVIIGPSGSGKVH